jgi:GntR family transcriptional regulator/MocR family aminotransferase
VIDNGTASIGFRPYSILPFQMGLPALDEFPRKIWARLGARVRARHAAVRHDAPLGLRPAALRAEIAAYLQVSRGIHCAPSQVFVTSGYRHSIELIGLALLKAGDRVWLEDPGYPPTRELLAQMHIATVPVPVDADGMVVAEKASGRRRVRAAVVTPAHQSPLCVSLSLPRRLALLDWAGAQQRLDRRGRLRRRVPLCEPPAACAEEPGPRRPRALCGHLQQGAVSEPPAGLSRGAAGAGRALRADHPDLRGGSPELTQSIVTAFIKEGHFARHIQRMRKLYAERREATKAGLEKVLGKHVRSTRNPAACT